MLEVPAFAIGLIAYVVFENGQVRIAVRNVEVTAFAVYHNCACIPDYSVR